MKNTILAALAMVSVGIVAGCGGGSGSGTTTPPTTSISGKIADGYLVGAKVFLDKNDNYQWDQGEPFAMTDANGAYTLSNVDPADLTGHAIVALAIKNSTIDTDTGAAIANSYVLSMPKGSIGGTVNSNFISPMSSQLRAMMDTGNYATMQDAMTALNTKLGLGGTGTNLMADYLAPGTSNTTVHTAATNMATLMGSQMNQVLSTSGTSTSVDAGRYQGMMVAIFQNMSSIKGSSPNTQSAMSNLMGTMTTTLQGTTAGTPFRNISTSIRGMMGASGSSTIGGMMK